MNKLCSGFWQAVKNLMCDIINIAAGRARARGSLAETNHCDGQMAEGDATASIPPEAIHVNSPM